MLKYTRRLKKTGPLWSFWSENCKFTSNSGGVISRLKILYVYNYDRDFAIHMALHVRGIYFLIYELSVVDAANEKRYE
jgi:hypothetical protein